MTKPRRLFAGLVVATALVISERGQAQGLPDYELPPIEYSASTPSNAITGLETALKGAPPPAGSELDRLRWLLATNQVPVESQVLVFSRTSLQRSLIEPRQPRALYFSDNLYIGWVPGGLMEVTVTDPDLGLVFYRLDARDPTQPLHFERDADCLSCHGGSMTRNWPGLMVRSVFPDSRGEPITSAGSFLVGHDTPLAERWGGWYVTGHHGTARHLGNVIAQVSDSGATLDREAGANRRRLDGLFPTGAYLRPDSDIVALMVLEHQVMIHNRLCEGALRVRKWSHYQRQLQKELGEPVSEEPVGTALRVVQSATDRILEALLFCDEATLPEGGIRGAGDFDRAFTARRRPDTQGRSLRDLDLQTRLFTHRCSYMVYSTAFAALPPELKRHVFRELDRLLTAATPPAKYAHLSSAERRIIREILLDTHSEFAAWAGTPPHRSASTTR